MIILGIDPGKTTGTAMLDVEKMSVVDARQMTMNELFDSVFYLVGSADLVAVEHFTISMRTIQSTRQPEAMYAIGAVKMACHRGNVPHGMQMASDAKNAFTDDVLRQLGVYDTSRHVRDATRHALLAARRTGKVIHVAV